MSRFLRGASVLVALALVAAACGGDGDPEPSAAGGSPGDPASITGTVRLSRYSDGFDPDYLASFYETYPNIDLETSSFGSNEEAIAKIQAGFEADVVNSCVDEATLEMVQQGHVHAARHLAAGELGRHLCPAMQELPGVQVDGQVYIVPVDAGTAGIMYNADVITTPPDSWKDLFDPQCAGRAWLEDIAITALDSAALANGIEDPLDMTDDQLDQVKQYLIDHRDQFRTFCKGQADIRAQFKSGEIVISLGLSR